MISVNIKASAKALKYRDFFVLEIYQIIIQNETVLFKLQFKEILVV